MLVTQTWGWVIVLVHTSFIHRIPIKSRFTSHNKNTKRDRWDHKQFLKIFDWRNKNVTSWVTNFKLDFSSSLWYNIRAATHTNIFVVSFDIVQKEGGAWGQTHEQNSYCKSVKVCEGLLKGRIGWILGYIWQSFHISTPLFVDFCRNRRLRAFQKFRQKDLQPTCSKTNGGQWLFERC